MKEYKERYYPESRFGGFTDVDGTIAFYSRVNALIGASSVVLDVGCGRGGHSESSVPFSKDLRVVKGKAGRVIGIDVDPNAGENPYLDEFLLINGSTWPVESDSVDLVICDYVLEHLEDPDSFFLEVRRVLKDQGYICIRTSNRWGYVALAATLIPNRYHAGITSAVQEKRKEEDVFPVVYKCNTIRKIRTSLNKNGFDCVVYGYEAEPSYLSFSRLAYFLGVLHQRHAPKSIKPSIFAFGKLNQNIHHG